MSNVVSMAGKGANINKDGRWAGLRNVTLTAKAVERAMNRSSNLPGIVALIGPTGWGKSMAASYCANKYGGILVEARSFFSKKTFVEMILKEMGIRDPARTIADMMAQAAEELDHSSRPLMIDEMDHVVDHNMVELVRDLHDMSGCTILLVGEERLGQKLKAKSPRFYNRIRDWQQAERCSREDARALAEFYVDGVDVANDLLTRVAEVSLGIVITICSNLDAIRNHCQEQGLKKIDLAAWGKRQLIAGEDLAPRRK